MKDYQNKENKILNIINKLKETEVKKGKDEEEIKYLYTHGMCQDLAMLIKSQFLNDENVKVAYMRLPFEQISHQAVVVTESENQSPKELFDSKGCFYDISGKTPLFKAGEYLHSFGSEEEVNLPYQITLNYIPFKPCFKDNETTNAVFDILSTSPLPDCNM